MLDHTSRLPITGRQPASQVEQLPERPAAAGSERFCDAAPVLGRRAHFYLAETKSPNGQKLREPGRDGGALALVCHDTPLLKRLTL